MHATACTPSCTRLYLQPTFSPAGTLLSHLWRHTARPVLPLRHVALRCHLPRLPHLPPAAAPAAPAAVLRLHVHLPRPRCFARAFSPVAVSALQPAAATYSILQLCCREQLFQQLFQDCSNSRSIDCAISRSVSSTSHFNCHSNQLSLQLSLQQSLQRSLQQPHWLPHSNCRLCHQPLRQLQKLHRLSMSKLQQHQPLVRHRLQPWCLIALPCCKACTLNLTSSHVSARFRILPCSDAPRRAQLHLAAPYVGCPTSATPELGLPLS